MSYNKSIDKALCLAFDAVVDWDYSVTKPAVYAIVHSAIEEEVGSAVHWAVRSAVDLVMSHSRWNLIWRSVRQSIRQSIWQLTWIQSHEQYNQFDSSFGS